MLANFRFPVFALITGVLLSLVANHAYAQAQNKSGVFSKLPTAQQPNAQQKRRLGSARTYAEKQRIKKQLTSSKPAPGSVKKTLVPGLEDKAQRSTGAKRNTTGRAFGPRQRVRAQSKQRGGLTAQGGTPAK